MKKTREDCRVKNALINITNLNSNMLYGIIMTIGLALCAISCFVIREKLTFIDKSEKAVGTVYEIREEEGGGETNNALRPGGVFASSISKVFNGCSETPTYNAVSI